MEHSKYKLKMLWYHGHWDHPLNGLAEYNYEKVYFNITDDMNVSINKYKYP